MTSATPSGRLSPIEGIEGFVGATSASNSVSGVSNLSAVNAVSGPSFVSGTYSLPVEAELTRRKVEKFALFFATEDGSMTTRSETQEARKKEIHQRSEEILAKFQEKFFEKLHDQNIDHTGMQWGENYDIDLDLSARTARVVFRGPLRHLQHRFQNVMDLEDFGNELVTKVKELDNMVKTTAGPTLEFDSDYLGATNTQENSFISDLSTNTRELLAERGLGSPEDIVQHFEANGTFTTEEGKRRLRHLYGHFTMRKKLRTILEGKVNPLKQQLSQMPETTSDEIRRKDAVLAQIRYLEEKIYQLRGEENISITLYYCLKGETPEQTRQSVIDLLSGFHTNSKWYRFKRWFNRGDSRISYEELEAKQSSYRRFGSLVASISHRDRMTWVQALQSEHIDATHHSLGFMTNTIRNAMGDLDLHQDQREMFSEGSVRGMYQRFFDASPLEGPMKDEILREMQTARIETEEGLANFTVNPTEYKTNLMPKILESLS